MHLVRPRQKVIGMHWQKSLDLQKQRHYCLGSEKLKVIAMQRLKH
jgi:hypothetical protein